MDIFDFKINCIFCGEEACAIKQKKIQKIQKYRKTVCEVSTIDDIHQRIKERAKERTDELGKIVLGRVDSVIDLVSAEAMYHKLCQLKFFFTSNDPECVGTQGRPADTAKTEAFAEMCAFLDNEDECQYSVAELHDFMENILDNLVMHQSILKKN